MAAWHDIQADLSSTWSFEKQKGFNFDSGRLACHPLANAEHAADPPVPSRCWRDEGSAPSGQAQERLRLSFYTLPPSACTLSGIVGRGWTRTQRLLLAGGSTRISQSSAGPIDGADDGIKMGTSGLLCEVIFAISEGEDEAVN
jgi:hypothetical protein